MSRGRAAKATLAIVTALAALGLASCTGEESARVRTATVGRATVTEVVEAPGTVAPKASATITAPADGKVAALRVREGQAVDAGSVILRIDSPQAEETLRQAEEADRQAASAGRVDLRSADLSADLSADEARADRATRAAFAAARRSGEKIPAGPARAQALAAVDAAEAQYAVARAQARQAVQRFQAGLGSLAEALASLGSAQRVQTRVAVQAARRGVDALVIRAPISGVVSFGLTPPSSGGAGSGVDIGGALGQVPEGLRDSAGSLLSGQAGRAALVGPVTEGAPVSTGQRLLTITDTSALSLTAEVDETDVLLVRPGVSADVELDAVPGATYGGEVRSVDLAPTPSGRGGVSYLVRLSLAGGTTADGEPAPPPRPGMSAVADMRVRTARQALAVPSTAVFRDGARDAVWVVDRGVAERRRVRLGAQGEAAVQIVDGLREGQQIVVSGADQVRAGQRLP